LNYKLQLRARDIWLDKIGQLGSDINDQTERATWVVHVPLRVCFIDMPLLLMIGVRTTSGRHSDNAGQLLSSVLTLSSSSYNTMTVT